jgi:hypothetical protein
LSAPSRSSILRAMANPPPSSPSLDAVRRELDQLVRTMIGPPDITYDALFALTPGQIFHIIETAQDLVTEVQLRTTVAEPAADKPAPSYADAIRWLIENTDTAWVLDHKESDTLPDLVRFIVDSYDRSSERVIATIRRQITS